MSGSWSPAGPPRSRGRPTGPTPGRGRYLIKNAGRLGIPVEMHLTPAERELYNTDTALTGTAPQQRHPIKDAKARV